MGASATLTPLRSWARLVAVPVLGSAALLPVPLLDERLLLLGLYAGALRTWTSSRGTARFLGVVTRVRVASSSGEARGRTR